jgi:transcriptional regulator with XRE-family HTH domain
MTGIDPPRRAANRRPTGYRGGRGDSGAGGNGRSPVGEQLRETRELRGFDLYRVERDTKIRAKYLEALESGDFGDLPGEVYTRGFLRNYAAYLGLDADEIIDEWRRETGEPAPAMTRPVFTSPQPMRIRRGIAFQRSHIIILVVVLIVAAVGSYFGLQVTRFLQYPTVAVSDPSGQQTLVVPVGTTSYVLKGTATPGTTVLVSWDGQDASTVPVDPSGGWTYTALLHFGSNQFDITAKNLDTSHASKTWRVIIQVPVITPSPPEPEIAFVTPVDGVVFKTGTVQVSGTSSLVKSVTLTPTYLGPPPAPGSTIPPAASTPEPTASPAPGASPGPSPSQGPLPTTVQPAADGTFVFQLKLDPGRWQLTIVGTDSNGRSTAPVSRTVVVPYTGLNVTIQVKGGNAWLKYFRDGVAVDSSTYQDGWQVTLTAAKSVCVYSSGRPNLVFVTVNGVSIGSVSQFGGVRVYIDLANPPRNVSSC